jgi:hypothetical protein
MKGNLGVDLSMKIILSRALVRKLFHRSQASDAGYWEHGNQPSDRMKTGTFLSC